MTVTKTSDSGMASLIPIYYEKIGLERLLAELVYYNMGVKKPIPKNSGKQVYFHRYYNFSLVVSGYALSESTAPTAGVTSATVVSGTLLQFGDTVQTSDLLSLTAVSDVVKDAVIQMGETAGQIVDRKCAEVCYGTSALSDADAATPSGAGFPLQYGVDDTTIGALSTLTSAHAMTVAGLRNAVKNLRRLNVKPFEDGLYAIVVHPFTYNNLLADSEWQAAYQYTDAENMRKGAVGSIGGVKVYVNTNVAVTASGTGSANTTSAYFSIMLGKGGLGVTEIDGQFRVYVVPASANDHSNPLQQYSTIGWKATFIPVILNTSCGRILATTDAGA